MYLFQMLIAEINKKVNMNRRFNKKNETCKIFNIKRISQSRSQYYLLLPQQAAIFFFFF